MNQIINPAPATRRGGMGREAWVKQQNGRKAVLYVIRLYGNGEAFYKLGITFCLSSRFSALRFVGYKWRTVARYSSWSAGRVFDLEAKLHSAGFVSYTPLLPFSGATECYADCGALLAALPAKTFVLKSTIDI